MLLADCTGELDKDYSSCCSPSHKCSEDEGSCHSDADCEEGLFCGKSMCPPKKGFHMLDSCCVKGNFCFLSYVIVGVTTTQV